MENLIINGIDYNRELDFLSEYLKEVINHSSPITIDVSKLPIGTDIEELIRLFKQTGDIIYSVGDCPIHKSSIDPIAFDEIWKKDFLERTSNHAW